MAAYKTNCYKCGVEVVRKKRCENPICDECKKEYQKEYREKNKDKLREQQKEWYQENKDEIKEYLSRPEVKERRKEYNKEYYSRPEVKEQQKEYRSKPEVKERRNERQKERKRTDIEFNIICRLRSKTRTVLNEYLKGKAKPQTTVEYLGCSIEYLKEYLESKFTEGMSWQKYLKGKIHIDHIKPCAVFDNSREEKREICFNYKNLQPLWVWENLEKGAKLDWKNSNFFFI